MEGVNLISSKTRNGSAPIGKETTTTVKSTKTDSQPMTENQFQTWMCIFMFNVINFEQYLFKCIIQ